MVSLELVSQYENQVVNLILKGEGGPVRGTIEIMDRDSVRIDAPYHGYRRVTMPLSNVLELTP